MDAHVGKNIRRLRKERGITQISLAETMFGDSRRQAYISAVERGEYEPALETLVKFAEALSCAVSDIQPLVSFDSSPTTFAKGVLP
nr:helix-turn-helix transcriptional regulator [Deinococcus indicus]